MLFAFTGMWRFGIAASLLSLGAIDFGLVVDSSVVMIENCVRHLSEANPLKRSRLEIVRDAAVEVRGPTMFGELIIMIVYLPILTLEGIEGKMFRPMAMTVIFALAGSMLMSMTLMPVLASLLLPKRKRGQAPKVRSTLGRSGFWGLTPFSYREPLLIRLLKRLYRPVLHFTMHQKFAVIGFALCVLVIAFGMIAPNLGTEFMPQLSEGAVAINVVRLGGHGTRRIVAVQFADGTCVARCVSRRSGTCLESHRFGGNRDRPDGSGTDRRVHHSCVREASGNKRQRKHELTRCSSNASRTCLANGSPTPNRSNCDSMNSAPVADPTSR